MYIVVMFRSDPVINLCADLVPGFAITQKSKFHIFKVLIEKICSIRSGIRIYVKVLIFANFFAIGFGPVLPMWIRIPGEAKDQCGSGSERLGCSYSTVWNCKNIQYRYFFCSLPLS
jgi:hypothetical protein